MKEVHLYAQPESPRSACRPLTPECQPNGHPHQQPHRHYCLAKLWHLYECGPEERMHYRDNAQIQQVYTHGLRFGPDRTQPHRAVVMRLWPLQLWREVQLHYLAV